MEWTQKNYNRLAEIATNVGCIMLESGAETYRVEDTIDHILRISGVERNSSLVITTAIVLTISIPEMDIITIVRRVRDRGTNLNRIYQMNQLSRELCSGVVGLEEAEKRIEEVRSTRQYSQKLHYIGVCGIVIGFTAMLGGGLRETGWSAVTALWLILSMFLCTSLSMNAFLSNIAGALIVALTAECGNLIWPGNFHSSVVIIGAIMPLVPGMAFTNGIRDLMYGDYTAAIARVLEAIVTALAIALGVGLGLSLFGMGVRV